MSAVSSPRGKAARRRRHWPLTGRGTGAVLAGIGCLVAADQVGVRALQHLGVLLIALVVVSLAAMLLVPPRIDVSRRLRDDVIEVGATTTVTLRMTSARGADGQWMDALPAELSGESHGSFVASAGTGDEEYAVTGMRRGEGLIGPALLTVTDPFRLVRRRLTVAARTPLLVLPRLVALDPLTATAGDDGGLHALRHRRGHGVENVVPRSYAPGDSVRRVHWRATAHRGELMVRQEEQEAERDAVVVLDRDPSRWGREAAIGHDADFERAVVAVASIAMTLVGDGFTVRIVDDAGVLLASVTTDDDTGRAGMQGALARISPRDDATTPVHEIGATGPLVAVTGIADHAAIGALTPLARRAATAVLLAASLSDASMRRAAEAGFTTVTLGGDLATSWRTALTALSHDGAIEAGDA